jgi:hypothetical protein
VRTSNVIYAALAAGVLSLVAAIAPTLAAAPGETIDAVTYALPTAVAAQFSGDLRELPAATSNAHAAPRPYRPRSKGPRPVRTGEPERTDVGAQLVGPHAPMPAPIRNFAGMSKNDACAGGSCGDGWPPDTNGDVGPNHYIQAVNSSYAIYDKASGTRLAAFTENQLWSGSGAALCDGSGQGDPIVLYDARADRWILTHFAFGTDVFGAPTSPFYQCIAASKTSDPVGGGWWLYAVRMDPGGAGRPPVGALNDYAKFGVWHDCIYMGSNEFGFPSDSYLGVAFASFSRADLYSGAPLTPGIGFLPYPANHVFGMFPANDLGKGMNAVLPGTPGYFVMESLDAFAFEVRKFTPGPNCGPGGTLGGAVNVPQSAYSFDTMGNEVPQPPPATAANLLDNLGDVIMQKVQYRRIGGTESLWVVHNIDTAPGGPTAMQWAQINVTGGTINPAAVQQAFHAPDASLWRWMGSLAVDGQGNMALGYSTSNAVAPNFPSIAYAGRLAGDPPNTLPQTELQLIAGGGSQTNSCGAAPCHRWGDYSAMSIDPLDDCTFWYTNQYYDTQPSGTSGNWHTRIGSFKFPTCQAQSTRLLVPDGTSESQTFSAFPQTRWFVLNVEPGKTYVIDTLDPGGDLAANAIGTLAVFGADGVSAPPEASVDCSGANGPRPPAIDVAGDGLRCIVRTVPPTAGMQQNKRPVYVKVTRMDPATGGGAQFRIRAREATVYGRWTTAGYEYHVEVENTTADPMCVEVSRYPASGLAYTPGPGWSGALASFVMTVPAFGAVKQVIAKGSVVGAASDGTLRVNACASPTNLVPGALHVSTYAFDPATNRYVYFFTTTANEGRTRATH